MQDTKHENKFMALEIATLNVETDKNNITLTTYFFFPNNQSYFTYTS